MLVKQGTGLGAGPACAWSPTLSSWCIFHGDVPSNASSATLSDRTECQGTLSLKLQPVWSELLSMSLRHSSAFWMGSLRPSSELLRSVSTTDDKRRHPQVCSREGSGEKGSQVFAEHLSLLEDSWERCLPDSICWSLSKESGSVHLPGEGMRSQVTACDQRQRCPVFRRGN